MPHIISTMTHDVKYTTWSSNPGGINSAQGFILIKGGHGVARRDLAGGLHTPNGVVTAVSDEQLAILEKDEVFQAHLKHGAVKIVKTAPRDVPKVTADMSESPDRPLTAKDTKKGGRLQVPDSMKANSGEKLQ